MRKLFAALFFIILVPHPHYPQAPQGDWPASWPPGLIGRLLEAMDSSLVGGIENSLPHCSVLNDVTDRLRPDEERDMLLPQLSESAVWQLGRFADACALHLSSWARFISDNYPSIEEEVFVTLQSSFDVSWKTENAKFLRLMDDYEDLGERYNELVKQYNVLVQGYRHLQTMAAADALVLQMHERIEQQLLSMPTPLHCTVETVDYGPGFQRSHIRCY